MTDMQVTQVDGVTVVRLSGELTQEGMASIERGFNMTISAAPAIVVDVSGVSMITTPGITLLVAADRQTRRRNGKLVLCGLTGNVEQVLLERCRLDVIFQIRANVDEAVAAAKL